MSNPIIRNGPPAWLKPKTGPESERQRSFREAKLDETRERQDSDRTEFLTRKVSSQ